MVEVDVDATKWKNGPVICDELSSLPHASVFSAVNGSSLIFLCIQAGQSRSECQQVASLNGSLTCSQQQVVRQGFLIGTCSDALSDTDIIHTLRCEENRRCALRRPLWTYSRQSVKKC